MRWRMASMDSDEIFRASPSSGSLVVLDLFDDVPMRAQVRSAKTLESGSSFLFGTLKPVRGPSVPMNRRYPRVVAMPISPTVRTFRCPSSQAPVDSGHSNPIDILVFYEQRAEDHEGGPEELHQVLENSGLAHRRLRLAATERWEGKNQQGRILRR